MTFILDADPQLSDWLFEGSLIGMIFTSLSDAELDILEPNDTLIPNGLDAMISDGRTASN